MTRRHVLALLATGTLALGVAVLLTGGATYRATAADSPAPPNFVVVVTDDQTLEAMSALPKTRRIVGGRGTTFRQAVVTTPHCCPSRATMLTGQYAHNHGVLSNKHGYPSLRDPGSVLPVWLQRAGYRTIHLGKWLNGYEKAVGPITEVAPGWDEWHTLLKPRRYQDYELQVNGRSVRFGAGHRDYLTRVLNKRATRLIKRYGGKKQPFYLQLDHYAPHTGAGDRTGECSGDDYAAPDPGEYRRYDGEPLPKPKSFNERDISDKPGFMKKRDRLSRGGKKRVRRAYRCALASLRTVDQGVKDIFKTLKREGLVRDTVIIFTSDNGYFYGEHRIPGSKTLPYEESVRVPLLVRLPKPYREGKRVERVRDQVANIDLAPTILDLARAEPCVSDASCRRMDGRSLMPLLESRGRYPGDRAIAVELTQGKDRVRPGLSCSYQGLRTTRRLYVEHTSVPDPGTRRCRGATQIEHYDLREDRFQLESLHPPRRPADRAIQRRLADRLEALRDCAGIRGREEPPAGGANCE